MPTAAPERETQTKTRPTIEPWPVAPPQPAREPSDCEKRGARRGWDAAKKND